MRSCYLRICVYSIEKWPFSGTYPLIYSDRRSFYMQIHYMWAYFWSPYLSHKMRSTCTLNRAKLSRFKSKVINIILCIDRRAYFKTLAGHFWPVGRMWVLSNDVIVNNSQKTIFAYFHFRHCFWNDKFERQLVSFWTYIFLLLSDQLYNCITELKNFFDNEIMNWILFFQIFFSVTIFWVMADPDLALVQRFFNFVDD